MVRSNHARQDAAQHNNTPQHGALNRQEDVLPATLQQMWDQLCTAVEHYLTYPAAGEFSTRSRNAAADALLAYAKRVEVTPEFQHLLTPNLHMLL